MYAVIRRYEGITPVDEVIRRIDAGWLPLIKAISGFVAYHVVDAGNGAAASVSIFDNQCSAEQSSQRAAAWLVEGIGPLTPNPHGRLSHSCWLRERVLGASSRNGKVLDLHVYATGDARKIVNTIAVDSTTLLPLVPRRCQVVPASALAASPSELWQP